MNEKTDRKQEILQAAIACFNEAGIEATSIDAIRARCGASVGSIYHHFGNKEGIVAHLFLNGLDAYWQQLLTAVEQAKNGETAVKAMVATYVDWVVANQDLARFIFQARTLVNRGDHGRQLQQNNKDNYRQVLARFKPWLENGSLRQLPPELYPALIIGPAQEYCRAWLSGRVKTDPRSLIEPLADAAWRAVGH